jgi:ubiquinone biosynthesis protein COQ4
MEERPMVGKIDQIFGTKFLKSVENFNEYGIHFLFNDWWESAPADAIEKYVALIENDPVQGPLAAERYYAPPLSLAALEVHAPGTLGAQYLAFVRDHNLMESLAVGYRDLHEQFEATGVLKNLPDVLKHKVLRGYQTHDLHHVITGYPPTPLGELAVQAFQLAQTQFPYASMWIAVVTAHMTFIDPHLTVPAMNAITHGWSHGRTAKSLQFVKFEEQLDEPLELVRRRYDIRAASAADFVTPNVHTPDLLVASR